MAECPHIGQSQTVALTLKDLTSKLKDGVSCSVCGSRESVWVCVTCGQLNCGRYVKAHALAHYEGHREGRPREGAGPGGGHSVCLECNEMSVFCYACDDFIVNDTHDTKLDRMRSVLSKHHDLQSSRDPVAGDESHVSRVKMASDESSSAAAAEPKVRNGRKSGKRKASSSSLSSQPQSPARSKVKVDGLDGSHGVENQPTDDDNSISKETRLNRMSQKNELRNLVGLRNLGNTCFMSAVLQSLGNIHEFCKGLKQLPSLEEKVGCRPSLSTASSSSSSPNSSSPSSTSSSSSSSSSSSVSGKAPHRWETRKSGFAVTTDGPIMTEELRKVLVALNQGPAQQDHHRVNNNNGKLQRRNSVGGTCSVPADPAAHHQVPTDGATHDDGGDSNNRSKQHLPPMTRRVISPEALFLVIWKVVPRFRGYQQQDAHEFLRYMLDRLHTELLSLLPPNYLLNQPGGVGAGMGGRSPAGAPGTSAASYYSKVRVPAAFGGHHRSRLRLSGGTGPAGSDFGLTSSHSLVTHLFGGTLQSEVTCLNCDVSSKKHDPFLDLSIDIPSKFVQFRKPNKVQQQDEPETPTCQLYDCLQKFVEVEELADSERFFCNNCKSKQRSTKKFSIRRLPNVLCLHIKRFRWSPYSRTKLDTHVSFPLLGLDMSRYLLSNLHETRCSNSGSCKYDLAAVIVHHGSGAGSGHYTAFVVKNNHWYHFNDSTVLATEPETVIQSKAYILFYIQREFKGPSLNS